MLKHLSNKNITPSIILNVFVIFITFFLLHIFGQWTISDKINGTVNRNIFTNEPEPSQFKFELFVLICRNTCALININHEAVVYKEVDRNDCRNVLGYFRVNKSVYFTLSCHWLTILLVSIILSPFTRYFAKKKSSNT